LKIKGVSRLVANEYPEAMPWIARLLSPLNESLGSMFLAMTRNITFADNIYCSIRELDFTHNVESNPIAHGLKSYLGCQIIGTSESTDDNQILTGFRIRRIDNESIAIKVLFNGGGTTQGKVKFIVLGG